MGRNDNFGEKPRVIPPTKSLRHNAREAAEYLTGIPYKPDYDTSVALRTAGRGASGEHNN